MIQSISFWINVIYLLEAVIKMFALGLRGYFYYGWNIFDFVVVIATWVEIMCVELLEMEDKSTMSVLRAFRIGRILHLILRREKMKSYFDCLLNSLVKLVNLTAIISLFIFMYAILGIHIFGKVKHQDDWNSSANFETFERAAVTLFRLATMDGWDGVMNDVAMEKSITNDCY